MRLRVEYGSRAVQFLVLITSLACIACNAPRPAEESLRVVRRDSAGIEIVEHTRPDTGIAQWRIAPSPTVRLGGEDSAPDEEPYQFDRVQGVAQMPTGEILVADFGSTSVRVFDSAGVYLRDLVRRGGGPSELYAISRLFRTRDDSVFVYNGEAAKLRVFGPDLQLVRGVERVEFRPDSTRRLHSSPGVRAIFDDGSVLGSAKSAQPFNVYTDKPGQPARRFTDSTWFVRGAMGESQLGDFGWLIGERGMYVVNAVASYRVFSLFEPKGLFAVRGTQLYYADGRALEIRIFNGDGTLRRIVRHPHTVVPFSTKDAARVAEYPTVADAPTMYPALHALHVDFDGNIWAATTRAEPQASRTVWLVFDSTGVVRAEAVDASNMNVIEIGRDYLLGIVRDALGVESVVNHALRR